MPGTAPPYWRERLPLSAGIAAMTAGAAWISYASTSFLGLREGYWAAISAIVVMQSDLSSTENSARDRFIGTAIGGFIGWLCATYWHQHIWIYVAAVGFTIFLCWLTNIGAAGRLGAVTVTVIVLIPRSEALWKIALFRFLEVSWGIAVAIGVQYAASWLRRRYFPTRPPSGV